MAVGGIFPNRPNFGRPMARASWLMGPSEDLLFLIATPVLLLPIFALAQRIWSDGAIVFAVTIFGANAHHLPGLLRAYGDPQFRRRFRWRLSLAPIGIAGVCLTFFHLELHGLLFVAFVWGIWHALAQVYGVGRIYDARASLLSPVTARLDKALCIGWFFGGFLFSPHRMNLVLTEIYRCGLPAISPEVLTGFRVVWMAGTTGITLAWIWNQTRLSRRKQGNPVKLVLFSSSILFWWYANIPIESAAVGVVLFEAFHDVQYLTTVWLYNKRLANKAERIGAFTKLIFRPGLIGLTIYVGFCWVYGSAGLIGKQIFGEGATTSIGALVVTSLLLHFYYDSFLWNVREKSVQDDLGLKVDAPTPDPIGTSRRFSLAVPGLAWAWFVLPLTGLLVIQLGGLGALESDWRAKLAYSLPTNEKALLGLGESLFSRGEDRAALQTIERAAELNPGSIVALRDLVEAYSRLGQRGEADLALTRLDELAGVDARSLTAIGVLYHDLDRQRAERAYLRALEFDASDLGARSNLADLKMRAGDLDAARLHLLAALLAHPGHPVLAYNLGSIEEERGDLDAAAEAYEGLLRAEPDHLDARRGLRRIQQRRSQEAAANH